MTTNPYAPGMPDDPSDAAKPDSPPVGPPGSAWRGAKRGARIAAWVSGAISLMLIIPAAGVTAFGLGAGRGFGVSNYLPGGIAFFLFFCALGGMVGGSAAWISALIEARQPGRTSAPAPRSAEWTAKPRRRPRRWPWVVGVPLLLFLVAAFVLGAYTGRLVDRRLAAAIAAADRDDSYWRLDDLLAHREQVPDVENSAVVLDAVLAHVPDNWPDGKSQGPGKPRPASERVQESFGELDATPGNVRLSNSVSETLRGELKSHEKAVQLARTLANYRRGRHELVIGRTVFDTMLPQSQAARTGARLLAADAAMRAHDGDLDGALDSCRAIFATGRSIGDEPFLISLLVRVAIGEIALKATGRALGQGEASDAALVRVQDLVLDEMAQPLLVIGVKGERAGLTEVIRRLRSGEVPISAMGESRASDDGATRSAVAPWGKLWFDQQQAVALEWMNEAVAIARRPEDERPALWNLWGANIAREKENPLDRYITLIPTLFTPDVPAASIAYSRYQTDLRAHAILLAAERHRRKTGGWPVSVATIDRALLPSAPVDPFAGQAFRMEHRDGRLCIYSIGPNGIDEQGSYDPKRWMRGGPDDAGAQAWDASMRRWQASDEVDESTPALSPSPR
jgi:hypothetical protein